MSKYETLLLDEFEEEEIKDYNLFEDNLDIKNKIEDEKIIYYDEFEDNSDNQDIEDEFYDIITDSNLIPEIKIEIETDDENNKSVKFTLEILINEEKNDRLSIDLNIGKKTFLLIAEELFK
jgi:hypothetical protein